MNWSLLITDSFVKFIPWHISMNMERELGSLILATDISRQNDYLSRFRKHLDNENLCLSNASHRHFILQVRYFVFSHLRRNKNGLQHVSQTVIFEFIFCLFVFFKHLVQMTLKCADICNPCRPWELSKQWSEKVTEEFFQQGYMCFVWLFNV